MADIDDAFAALENLNEEGLKALKLCGAVWQEILQQAAARTERAEYVLWQLYDRASEEGVVFDFAKASAEWDAKHERWRFVLLPWLETLQAASAEKLRDMRLRLRKSHDRQLRATLAARRERERREAVEAERDALLAEVERLRARGDVSSKQAELQEARRSPHSTA